MPTQNGLDIRTPRRILIVGRTPQAQEPVGGLEIMILRLAEELSKHHEVTLASAPGPARTASQWEERPGETFKRYQPTSEENLHKQAAKSDLIMVNQRRDLITQPDKTVLMLHGAIEYCYPDELADKGEKTKLIKQLDQLAGLAACSKWAAEATEKIAQRETTVLYPPIDPAFRAVGAVTKRNVVGYSGRLSPYKGADLVPAVAKLLAKAGLEVEMTRFAADPGSEKQFLEAERRGEIRLVEPFKEPAQHAAHLASLAGLLVPSRVEGFGLLAAEAQAAGTFVIASNIGGLAESVLLESGTLTDGSVEQLAKAAQENA